MNGIFVRFKKRTRRLAPVGIGLWVLSAWGATVWADPAVDLFKIPAVRQQIAEKKVELESDLSALPQLEETLQLDAYGYHGGYLPALEKLPSQPRWTVDFEFEPYAGLLQVILVPAVDRRFDRQRSYGFPKRFRLLRVGELGDTQLIREWMSSDFPDPGRIPLMVEIPKTLRGNKVRLEVFRGAVDHGQEWFALDELFGISANAIYQCIHVDVSSSYESLPYWSTKYVNDQKTNLGLPVGRGGERSRDFVVVLPSKERDDYVVELDLGINRKLGWITFYPAMPPEGILIPGYGFPGEITLEIVRQLESGDRAEGSIVRGGWFSGNPGNNVVRLPGYSQMGRWLRIHCKELPEHNGLRTFAMGDIHLYKRNEPFELKGIALEGFPPSASQDAPLLIDRESDGRPIHFLLDWLKQIKRRDTLSRRLTELSIVETELAQRWHQFWSACSMGGGVLIVLFAFAVMILTLIQRRQGVLALKRRITRDLHDEVGSSLGSIALTAEQLVKRVEDVELKAELSDLSLMTREAGVSLREVVWVIDQEEILLPALLQKMVERAERVLHGVVLSVNISSACPAQGVSLTAKRHLLLFFKEVVHNCARHAQATAMQLNASVSGEVLVLVLSDDGVGFDPAAPSSGWGVKSMKSRAAELGGTMELISARGQGTTICLKIPVAALSKEANRGYNTSN